MSFSKLKQKYVTLGIPANLVVSQLVAAGVAFLVNLLSSSVMNPSERGELAFVVQLSYFATVFTLIGVERPFIAEKTTDFYSAVTSFRKIVRPGTIIIVLGLAVGLFFLFLEETIFGITLIQISLYAFTNNSVRTIRVAYIVSGEKKPFYTGVIGTQLLLLVFAVALFLMQIDSPGLWFLAYVMSTSVAAVIVWTKKSRIQMESKDIKDLRTQGFKLIPGSISASALSKAEKLLLPILSTNAQLGLYVVVVTVMDVASWPVHQWVESSLRHWRKKRQTLDLKWLAKLLLRAGLISTVISIILSSLTYWIILFILPESYRPSIKLIVPLAISSILLGLSRVSNGILIAQKKMGVVSIIDIAVLAIMLVSFVLLVPSMGAMGAAIGSLIGSITLFLLFTSVVVIESKAVRRSN